MTLFCLVKFGDLKLLAISFLYMRFWRASMSLILCFCSGINNVITFAAEMNFLDKRQLAWEDSFRSLYYMLRKSGCNVFYGKHQTIAFPYLFSFLK